jgi:hypothetical protein
MSQLAWTFLLIGCATTTGLAARVDDDDIAKEVDDDIDEVDDDDIDDIDDNVPAHLNVSSSNGWKMNCMDLLYDGTDPYTAYDVLKNKLIDGKPGEMGSHRRRRRSGFPFEVADDKDKKYRKKGKGCPDYDKSTGPRIECAQPPPGLPPALTVARVFKFELHREDCDPTAPTTKPTKSRNEIKVYAKSPKLLKGYEGDTMEYKWWFYVDPNMTVTSRFTHIFQIKAVGGDTQKPLATITVVDKGTGSEPQLQVRSAAYSIANPEWARTNMTGESVRAETGFNSLKGKWVQAQVDATMKTEAQGGRLKSSSRKLTAASS